MNNNKLEDDMRLDAYLEFLQSDATELIRIEEDSQDDDEIDEIISRDDDILHNPLYKNIIVDLKILSPFKQKLLIEGRQMKAYEKNHEMLTTDLEELSFKDVWENLVHMNATKQFCKFLKDRPNLKKPKYLVDASLFNNN